MWDVVVVVVQLACAAFLVAGAILSLWFRGLPQPSAAPVPLDVSVELKEVAVAEAVVKPLPPLRRAA
jgi:hypothetical protein